MYQIVKKMALNPTVTLMAIKVPLIAKKTEPGQFIILRVDENGERIPLTIADYDRQDGTVTIIFQIVGATTLAQPSVLPSMPIGAVRNRNFTPSSLACAASSLRAGISASVRRYTTVHFDKFITER